MKKEKNSSPLISVIVPVYNTAPYLKRCINSILNQTYKELEIICVDDGSVDQSPKILDEFADLDDRIKVYHVENQGVSSARNKALMAATGSYIGFVDSDDYLSVDYYEELVNVIVHGDVDIATCGYYFDNSGKITIAKNKEKVPTEPMKTTSFFAYMYERDTYKGVGSYLWTRLIKRELIKKSDGTLETFFKKEYGGIDDIVFVAEVSLKSNNIQYIDKPLYYYFQREGSIVHDDYMQLNTLCWVKAYEEILDRYQEYGVNDSVLDIIKRMYVYRCGKLLEKAIEIKDIEKINILKDKIKKEFLVYVRTNLEHLERVQWIIELILYSMD